MTDQLRKFLRNTADGGAFGVWAVSLAFVAAIGRAVTLVLESLL